MQRQHKLIVALLGAACSLATSALSLAPPSPLPAGDFRLALERLNVLGSALYLAAHPDDENTAVLS